MSTDKGILLSGLDGANPLAFLAALGTLRTLALAIPDEAVKMRWEQHDGAWRPRVWCSVADRDDALVDRLHDAITVKHTASNPDVTALKKRVAEKKKAIKKATDRLRARRLKGSDLKAAKEAEIKPLEREYEAEKAKWLSALSGVVPSLELSLGRDLSASTRHYRSVALRATEDNLGGSRHAADMLAVFGSEVCADVKSDRIEASPFCFITGSGHQYFLDTITALMSCVNRDRIRLALFDGVSFRDEKLSMRWAPAEDRRYALMWADPTSPGNEPLTSWALNLLAYRGLSLVSASPTNRGFLTAGFSHQQDAARWIWPIWRFEATSNVVRSLLSDSQLVEDVVYRHHRGIAACFSAQRLVVGNPPLHKINFSPATPC